MATTFKCLIEFNNNKHRIIVQNNNDLKFGEVFKEIKQIIGQTLISRETHSFEIFDIDFKEYLLINSDNEIIENLSRIRVLPKTKSDKNHIKQKLNNKTESEAKVGKSFTAEKSHSRNTSLNSEKNENSSQELNNKNTCDSKRICDFILIKYINHFIEHFKADESIAWQMVSNQMIKNGFNHFNIMLCETQFNCLVSKFIEVLTNYKDYNNACNHYYLFDEFIKINFYPSLDSEMSQLVEKLKNKFNKKINYKEVFDSIDSYTNSETTTETKCFGSKFDIKLEENEAIDSESEKEIKNKGKNKRKNKGKNKGKQEMISLMIHLINKNSSRLKYYSNFDKLIVLSELMQENGYYDCDQKICMDGITRFNAIFVKILRNSQSYETACHLFPLFELLYESYENLKPFVDQITYNEVIDLRKKFKYKFCLGLESKPSVVCGTKQSSFEPILNK